MIKRRIELENDHAWAQKHSTLKNKAARTLTRKKHIAESPTCERCGQKNLLYTRKLCDKCFIEKQLEEFALI